jgi:2-oxoglutarate ferredoxin oxidoreductase subunit delta
MFVPLGHIPRYDDPRESTWGQVVFDSAKCTGCNMCVRVCPAHVIALDAKKARMVTTGAVQCIACGDCAAICPDDVITVTRSYRFSGVYETMDRGELQLPRL